MKRIAAPMVGGMVSSTILTLIVIPAIYSLWKQWEVERAAQIAAGPRGNEQLTELELADARA
jgi:hypothetical protein